MCRIKTCLLFILSLPCSVIAQNERIVLTDDFTQNWKSWPVGKVDGKVSFELSNGKFYLENFDGMSRPASVFHNLDGRFDFSVSIKTMHVSGADNYGYGLYFGSQDLKSWLAFEISATGLFMFSKGANGQTEPFIKWTASKAIKTGNNVENLLTIRQVKDLWEFLINGELVSSYKSQSITGYKLGFMTEGNQRIAFDDLQVKSSAPKKIYKTKYCIIENGVLKDIDVEQTEDNDITAVIYGKTEKFWSGAPPKFPGYAGHEQWYMNNEPIQFNGKRFVKYGLPRILESNEIRKMGEYKNVGVYAEAGSDTTVIYVPVRPGCEWQPYQFSCHTPVLSTKTRWVVAGDKLNVFTDNTHDLAEDTKYKWTVSPGKIIKTGLTTIDVSTAGITSSNIRVTLDFTSQNKGCPTSTSITIPVVKSLREKYNSNVCVVENGILKQVGAYYDVESNLTSTVIAGKRYDYYPGEEPSLPGFASNEPWFKNGETIAFNNVKWKPQATSIYAPVKELKKTGTYKNIGIYEMITPKDSTKRIYVPYSVSCMVKEYIIICPEISFKSEEGNRAIFGADDTVKLKGEIRDEPANAKYIWTVGKGTIIKGQGTKEIEISTVGLKSREAVEVTLSLTPKSTGCQNAATNSYMIGVNRPTRTSPRTSRGN